MNYPLSHILTKTLVKGFYKAHSGLLIFFFTTVLTSCFFMNVLNQTHLPPDQIILYHLIIPLSFLNSPVIMILTFVIWLLYTVKSWQYNYNELLKQPQQFLFYSANSFDLRTQFKCYLYLQFMISLPFIIFSAFTFIIGLIFNYYVASLITFLYILLLLSVSAVLYLYWFNRLYDNSASFLIRLLATWKKPFRSLLLYHVFFTLNRTYLVTKTISVFLLSLSFYFWENSTNTDRPITYIFTLTIAASHSILLFESFKFQRNKLRFILNFPFPKVQVFSYLLLLQVAIVVPEMILLIGYFGLNSWGFILALLIQINIFHCLLFQIQEHLIQYIQWIFFLYIFLFLSVLFRVQWVLLPLSFVISYMIFNRNYYK